MPRFNLREALGEEVSTFGENWKCLRGDDQYEWKRFRVKVCRGCSYGNKDTAFEFVHTGKRQRELHYYGSISHYKLDEEKCPYCKGESNFHIITDGMKIAIQKRKK